MMGPAHGNNGSDAVQTWWSEIDDDILRCLEDDRIMTAWEIAQKLGVSESAAASFLALLALSNKVRIVSVQARPPAR